MQYFWEETGLNAYPHEVDEDTATFHFQNGTFVFELDRVDEWYAHVGRVKD